MRENRRLQAAKKRVRIAAAALMLLSLAGCGESGPLQQSRVAAVRWSWAVNTNNIETFAGWSGPTRVAILERDRVAAQQAVATSQTFGGEVRIPLVSYGTPTHSVVAAFDTVSLEPSFTIDGWPPLTIDLPAVPLKTLEVGAARVLIFLRGVPENRLTLADLDIASRVVTLHSLDAEQASFLDFRQAVVVGNTLVCVLYDNIEMRNYLYRFSLGGGTFIQDGDPLLLPSVDDPAGTHYEVTPDLHMLPCKNELFIVGGRRAFVYSMELRSVSSEIKIPGSSRFVEAVSVGDDAFCMYQTEGQGSYNPYLLYNLSKGQPMPYDKTLGIPFHLRDEDGHLAFDRVQSVEDLGQLFAYDVARSKASGAFYMGANNSEGSVPWSQVYYLNGLLDIVLLSQKSSRVFRAFEGLLLDIRQRLDLEMFLLDRLVVSDDGLKTLAFTAMREPALFAVQTARVLLLMKRYQDEIPSPIALTSYDRLRKMVYTLESHIEVLTTGGETKEWLKPGRHYLAWPKGCASWYDGAPVPYNHQNEWALSVIRTEGAVSRKSKPWVAARDIVAHFVDHLCSEGRYPSSFEWPYWWGIAYDGWTREDAVSTNTPAYAGDKSTAWISFRSIDAMTLLWASRSFPGLVPSGVEQYVVAAVSAGKLYPFVLEALTELPQLPGVNPATGSAYLRLASPQDLQNCAWAYLYCPLPQEAEDPASLRLNAVVAERHRELLTAEPTAPEAADNLHDYLNVALPFNLDVAEDHIGDELCGKYLAWNVGYDLDACMLGYLATDERRFLDLFSSAFDRVLALRDSQLGIVDDVRGRVMDAWGSNRYSEGEVAWTAWDAFAGMLCYPAAVYCRVVKEQSLPAEYQEQADAFLREVRAIIAGFDAYWRTGPGRSEGYYFDPTLNAAAPLNHMNLLGLTFVELYRVTGERRYKERASQLARFFRNRMWERGDGALIWEYWPKPETAVGADNVPREAEDITHAYINMRFALEAFKSDLVFTEEDMLALGKTLDLGVLSRLPDAAGFIDGSRDLRGLHENLPGWILLARFAPDTRSRICEIIERRSDLFPLRYFSYATGPVAFAYMMGTGD